MIELTDEFKMFLGRGMYSECSKIVLIKTRELILSKVNEKDKTFYSDRFEEVANEFARLYPESKELISKLVLLGTEKEDDDQVERLSSIMEIYNELEEN